MPIFFNADNWKTLFLFFLSKHIISIFNFSFSKLIHFFTPFYLYILQRYRIFLIRNLYEGECNTLQTQVFDLFFNFVLNKIFEKQMRNIQDRSLLAPHKYQKKYHLHAISIYVILEVWKSKHRINTLVINPGDKNPTPVRLVLSRSSDPIICCF